MFEDLAGQMEMDRDSGLMRLVPAADIVENKDGFMVTAELPGLKKEEIKVTVQNNVLTISGEKKKELESQNDMAHKLERSYGSFSRTFELPAVVDASRINAEFKDGVLKVELPKIEEAKPKEIAIGVE
jgi:HSP20 family protein